MHFVSPGFFVGMVPRALPQPRALVYGTGVLEIAGGVGLLPERTRRAAGISLIALLALVWPANLQMLLDAQAAGAPARQLLLLWLRLPMQLLPMAAIWYATLRRR